MTTTEPWSAAITRMLATYCACGTNDNVTQNSITGTWTCGDCRDNMHADASERNA